jgi:DNA-binding transcriptional regulator GbsR (MarR family)
MSDTAHQQRLTNQLQSSSDKLEELLAHVRDFGPGAFPAELSDEIATTAGELMVVLMEYQSAHRSEELIQEVITHARNLRALLRSDKFRPELLSQAIYTFTREVDQIIRESKLAA